MYLLFVLPDKEMEGSVPLLKELTLRRPDKLEREIYL